MLRCFIVDDSPRFLDAARVLLEAQGIAVVGVASTGSDGVDGVLAAEPDVVLVDIDLGAESGFDVVRRLQREAPATRGRLLLISTHDDSDYAELIDASPAVGFVSKTALSATAIQRALAHGGARYRLPAEPPAAAADRPSSAGQGPG